MTRAAALRRAASHLLGRNQRVGNDTAYIDDVGAAFSAPRLQGRLWGAPFAARVARAVGPRCQRSPGEPERRQPSDAGGMVQVTSFRLANRRDDLASTRTPR